MLPWTIQVQYSTTPGVWGCGTKYDSTKSDNMADALTRMQLIIEAHINQGHAIGECIVTPHYLATK